MQPRLAPTLILILVAAVVFVSPAASGLFPAPGGRATTEMARLCTGFLSLLIGMLLLLAHSPFLILLALTAAWAWPLATCFAEPVYSGAFWRHRLPRTPRCS